MKRHWIAGLFFPCVVLPGLASGIVEIESIQARLFLGHSGSLSAPLTKKDALFNTIVGGAEIDGVPLREPSESTLVDVIVRGKPGAFDSLWTLDLVITNRETGEKIGAYEQHAGVLGSDGRFHVAFLIPDTGCTPLHLLAKVRGTESMGEMNVDFVCRE
jgi:hypothetical protein